MPRNLGTAFVNVKPAVDKTGFARDIESAVGGIFGQLGVTLGKRLADGLLTTKGLVLAASAGTAVAVGVMFDKSIKSAGDFQAQMVKLTTTAGETGTLTSGNLKTVSDGILRLAGDTGTAVNALGDAMYKVESSGFRGADAVRVLTAAAQGARLEQADTVTVANALTSVMTSYNLKADQATRVTDMMVAAVGHGKLTFQEFSGSISQVLPLASSLHMSFAEVAGAMALMTNHGESADYATQHLRFTINAMAAPNAQAVKEMDRMGLSSVDLAGHLGERGLAATLQMVSEAVQHHMGPSGLVLVDTLNKSKTAAADAQIMLNQMPPSLRKVAQEFADGKITVGEWRGIIKGMPVDQADLARQFATVTDRVRGFNDFLKAGSPAAQTYQDAMKKITGGQVGLQTALELTGVNAPIVAENIRDIAAAGEHAGKNVKGWGDIQASFNFQMDSFKDRIHASGIQIGLVLLPAATSFMKTLSELLGPLFRWVGAHQQLSAIILSAVGGLGLFVTGVLALSKAAGIAVEVLKILRIVTIAEDAALMANPIGIVIGLLVLLGIALYEAWEHSSTFRRIVIGAWHGIETAALWTYHNVLLPVFHGIKWLVMEVVVPAVLWWWHNIVEPAFHAVATVALWLWQNVLYPSFKGWEMIFRNVIGPVVHWLYENVVRPVFQGIRVTIEIWWVIIKAIFEAWWGYITHFVAPIIEWLWKNVVVPYFEGMWHTIELVWNFIKPIFEALGDIIERDVAAKFKSGVSAIRAAWETVKDVAAEPISFMIDTVVNRGIIDTFNTVAGWFGVKDRVDHIHNPFQKADNSLQHGLAEGGHVTGPGTETSDSILAMLSHNEYVIPAHIVRKYGVGFFDEMIGKSSARYPGDASTGLAFADGGLVEAIMSPAKWVGGRINGLVDRMPGGGFVRNIAVGVINKMVAMAGNWLAGGAGTATGALAGNAAVAMAFLRGQLGKPYIWASAGPDGYDCSGIVSAVFNMLHGRSPYSHTFSTMDEAPYFPLPGIGGLLTAGWTNPGEPGPGGSSVGHTAGVLLGLPFESTGGVGVRAGAGVTPVGSFAHVGHFSRGGLVGGLRVRSYDSGGYLEPGFTLAHNGTGARERVGGGDVVTLDDYTISRIAQAIQTRPVRVQIDERNWAVSVAGVAL
jgi:cell wall-associated NlpC family hydrolase